MIYFTRIFRLITHEEDLYQNKNTVKETVTGSFFQYGKKTYYHAEENCTRSLCGKNMHDLKMARNTRTLTEKRCNHQENRAIWGWGGQKRTLMEKKNALA